jgi:CHASE2 domain-containing sensor protein
VRRAVRAVCAVVVLVAAAVAGMLTALLADDPDRWLPVVPWLVCAACVGAVAAMLLAVTGGRESERERVR